MRRFMYVVITVVMLAQYLSSLHVIPAAGKYLPDLMSGIVMLYVFVVGVGQGFRYVNIKYWLIFFALALVIACGPIVNQEAVGPVIAGVRYYLRSIPLFLVPAVINFSDDEVRKYMKFVLGFMLLQFPVSAYQRITGFSHGEYTGDIVIGTLMDSGVVSLFIICALCVMGALTLRGQLSKLWFAVCFVPLLITVSINETKVTAVLLPLATLLTFVLASPPGRRISGTLRGLVVLAVAAAIFVPLYNGLNKKDNGTQFFTIQEFITDPSTLQKYMNLNAGVGTGKEAGRGDAIMEPFRALSSDPVKFAFGLGVGNVSKSGMGEQYGGRYELQYWNFAQALSMSTFLFEIGILGSSLVLLLHGILLSDIIYVAKRDPGMMSPMALGYVGVWFTVTVGLFYATIHAYESISFMFWFFSGLFAARRQRLAMSRSKAKAASSLNFGATGAVKLKLG